MREWVLAALVAGFACDMAGDTAEESEPATTTVAGDDADRFVGTYRFSGGQKERDGVRDAIDDVVGEINVLFRGQAKDKLTEANPVFDTVEVARSGNDLTLKFGSLTNVCKLDGTASDVPGVTGDELSCRLGFQGEAIVQKLKGARGGRDNKLAVDDKGRLRLTVRIHSKLMPKDLRYTLTYRKQ